MSEDKLQLLLGCSVMTMCFCFLLLIVTCFILLDLNEWRWERRKQHV